MSQMKSNNTLVAGNLIAFTCESIPILAFVSNFIDEGVGLGLDFWCLIPFSGILHNISCYLCFVSQFLHHLWTTVK